MQNKRPWLTLFASGLALIILTSATTAILMNARFDALILTSSRELASQLAAAGLTQSSGMISPMTAEPFGTTQSTVETIDTTEKTAKPGETSGTVVTQTAGQGTSTPPTVSVTAATTTTRATAAVTTRSTTASTTKSTTTANQFITADQARKTALDRIRTANLQVVETELKSDEYPPKYEIKLVDSQYKYEVEIHAITGLVIEIDKEIR